MKSYRAKQKLQNCQWYCWGRAWGMLLSRRQLLSSRKILFFYCPCRHL